jgi:hypothetical protein
MTFPYKGKPVDAKAIGKDLGVRYALEGSVRRVGEKVEVNAQLIDAVTGAHVWADRFEGDRSKLGELQVDVVARLARSLDVELVKAEALRVGRQRPSNPDAVDLAMRGWALIYSNPTGADMKEAEALFERARALEPDNVPAMIGLARVLNWLVNMRWDIALGATSPARRNRSMPPWPLNPTIHPPMIKRDGFSSPRVNGGGRSSRARRRSRTIAITPRPTRTPVFGKCISLAARRASSTLKPRNG